MSMAVDLSTPLTKDEAAYLLERGRHQELESAAERHDQDLNELLNTKGDGTGPTTVALNSDLQAIQSPELLLARLREMGVNVKIADEDEDEEPDLSPYPEWSEEELKAEIDRRNTGRSSGDKISKAGGVQAMADRLYADDEKA